MLYGLSSVVCFSSMNRSKSQLDRVFVRPQYTLHYRRAARILWMSEARADYVVLFLLNGKLPGSVDEASVEITDGNALLLDPGVTASAAGRNTEYLSLTLSPSFMLDAAARTGLGRDARTVVRRATHRANSP